MPKLGTVLIRTREIEYIRVMCFEVAGFAVHPTPNSHAANFLWTVTHKMTGYAVASDLKSHAEAEEVANGLATLDVDWDFAEPQHHSQADRRKVQNFLESRRNALVC